MLYKESRVKYAWIKEHTTQWKVRTMCRLLEVSSSGYYDWINHKPSQRDQDNQFLDQTIMEIYKHHKGRYGSIRIWKELLAIGIHCSHNRVKRRLNKLCLKAKTKRKFKVTTDSFHNNPVAPNLLSRNFTASASNQKWVSDITYIWSAKGWLYLAVIIDLYSRSIVGWSMDKRINKALVCDALHMALWRRGFPKNVIIHSDRGSQYCSKRYQKMVKQFNLHSSMSRKGDCWDNAVAESFFHSLKVELVYQTYYSDQEEARYDVFEYIEAYYNRIRRHSSLDYKTPFEVEYGMQYVA